ncbi:MAG: PEP-CTERM sorting domain-containing protein [Acetobacteraceae bacterium]
MRRMALGLAAATIAGMVGFAGAAQATPAPGPVLLSDSTDVLTVGDLTWQVEPGCTTGGGGGCADFEMSAVGNGIVITAVSPYTSFEDTGATDLTVDIYEVATGSAISTVSWSAVGGPGSGSASITEYTPDYNGLRSIGGPTSGFPSELSLVPPATSLVYALDIPISSGLTSISLNVPVPEPATFGLLAAAMMLVAGARRRPVR